MNLILSFKVYMFVEHHLSNILYFPEFLETLKHTFTLFSSTSTIAWFPHYISSPEKPGPKISWFLGANQSIMALENHHERYFDCISLSDAPRYVDGIVTWRICVTLFHKGMCDNIVFYFFECLVGLIVIDMNRDKLTSLITYLMQIEWLVDGLAHKPNN